MIAVTGSTGFVGAAVLAGAASAGRPCRPLGRLELGELDGRPIPPSALAGCTAVIHLAARAHRMGEHGPEALAAYRSVNVAGTAALIAAAATAGVRRFLHVSSIKVVGERSTGRALAPGDPQRPEDPYGQSKAEAEAVVLAAHAAGRIQAVIVRPVLVHGPGAKGNLDRLLAALSAGRLLPLGSVRNRRSLLGVANLADALLTAATAPLAATTPPIYHLADDGVISTRRLAEVLAEGLGVRPRLLSVPRWLAVGGATLLGRGATARRLFDDLEVDDSGFRRDFAWKPHVGLEDGLRRMAADYARRPRP